MRYAFLFCVLFAAPGTSLAQAPADGPEARPAANDLQTSPAADDLQTSPAADDLQTSPAADAPQASPAADDPRVSSAAERPAAEPQAAASQISSLGMSILGNQEAPKSLVIVPWKSSEIGSGVGVSRALDTGIRAVDKEVFLRELKYYEIRAEGAK